MLRQLLLLSLVLGISIGYAIPRRHPARRRMIAGRPFFGFLPPPDESPRMSKAAVLDYIVQKVDNFDPSNTATYRQRYWYNQQWYQNNNIAFLMIGGESAESPTWVSNPDLEWIRIARQQGAMVFELEHRYYGVSQPTSDMTVENMKYLSSKQALADIAAFIPAMNTKFNLPSTTKWVTFGGSYSGALSAWFRLKYPNLVVGAVGSSGPVQAKVNFVEYFEVVQQSLRTYSADCADAVQEGFTQIQSLVATGAGRQTLKLTFNLCFDISTSPNELIYMYESLMDPYAFTVQYSGDNVGIFANQITIPAICTLLTGTSPILQRLKAVNDLLMRAFGEQCVYNSYSGFIEFMQNTGFNQESSDDRSWIWQTCTEFGYYQTTEGNNIIFGSVLPIDYYVTQWCSAIYGSQITNATVYAAIDSTNAYYGGTSAFTATNVVLPNGDVDPWHALGLLNSNIPSSPSILIEGTAHCADMYPPGANDKPGLIAARLAIESNVTSWLR
jgi:hypothetical protein